MSESVCKLPIATSCTRVTGNVCRNGISLCPNPTGFSLLPWEGREALRCHQQPQASAWCWGRAAEVAQLCPARGSGRWCLAGQPSPSWVLSMGCPGKKNSVGMSGLSCVRRKEEEAVSLRILEEQRCAEMMAEWLLQVVFGFCKSFFSLSFCFSVSFGSRGLAFHFQNRHLIKLVAFLNCVA